MKSGEKKVRCQEENMHMHLVCLLLKLLHEIDPLGAALLDLLAPGCAHGGCAERGHLQ